MSDESEKRLQEGLAKGEFVITPPEEFERIRKAIEQSRAVDSLGPLMEGGNPFGPEADIVARHRFDAEIGKFKPLPVQEDFTQCAEDAPLPDGSKWVYLWYKNQCGFVRRLIPPP